MGAAMNRHQTGTKQCFSVKHCNVCKQSLWYIEFAIDKLIDSITFDWAKQMIGMIYAEKPMVLTNAGRFDFKLLSQK